MTAESFDLTIDSIAAGGDGVGRHSGLVVFVPRTAPGDTGRVEAERQGRWMRGRLLDLQAPSAARVTPRCRHYDADRCGGCQLQHLSYEAQLAAKAGIIRDALERIGHLRTQVPSVVASDRQWRYRRKLTLTLRRGRAGWTAGLRRWDSPDEIFRLHDCEIADEAVMEAWRSVLAQARYLPDGRQLRAAVRLLGAGFSLTVEGGTRWGSHAALFGAIAELTELWWQPTGKRRRLLHSRSASAAGAAFTQVNAEVAAQLVDWVVSLARDQRPTTAVDAYAGTGDIAVALAALGARVTAIERDRDAAALCAARLPTGSKAVAASVESALPTALPADLVVVNPPRAGLNVPVVEALQSRCMETRARHAGRCTLIYVSCNPATLARDLYRLDRYVVKSVSGFDMFPQTAHVETVCALEPAA